jgi:hypothetical protein
MSTVHLLLLSISTLLLAPTAHAADDEICVGWVHNFVDAEVKGDTVTITSENTCLMRATTLDDFDRLNDGKKPYRGGVPGLVVEEECSWIERRIDEMRRALSEAREGLPGAIEARDAAAAEARDALADYEHARDKWLAAQAATEDAKAAYADVYEVVVETQRDAAGHVVVVRQVGYRSNTALGRAVLAAIQAEEEARTAMDDAWAKWAGVASSNARAAQFRVDHYNSIVTTYPTAIEEARAYAAELGCN